MAGKVKVDYAEATKKMAAAKTGKEILDSWAALNPTGTEIPQGTWEQFGIFAEKAPQILDFYCHRPLAWAMENGVLDAKTRELILVALCTVREEGQGLVFHVPAALGVGCTEEEVLEAVHLGCYEFGKIGTARLGAGLKEAFRQASLAGLP